MTYQTLLVRSSLVFFLCAPTWTNVGAQTSDLLWNGSEPGKNGETCEDPSFWGGTQYRCIKVDFDVLRGIETASLNETVFAVSLPDGSMLDVQKTGFRQAFAGLYSFYGKIAGEEFGTINLVWDGKSLNGAITLTSGTYRVKPDSQGDHVLFLENADTVPRETQDYKIAPKTDRSNQVFGNKSGFGPISADIDVLFVYTTETRLAIEGDGGTVESNFFLLTEWMNLAFDTGLNPDVQGQ